MRDQSEAKNKMQTVYSEFKKMEWKRETEEDVLLFYFLQREKNQSNTTSVFRPWLEPGIFFVTS